MNQTLRSLVALAICVALSQPGQVQAQADNEWIGPATSLNGWNVDSNWSAGGRPDPSFDDNAKLGTDTGVAGMPTSIEVTLTTDLTSTPAPRVILGEGAGYVGTLNLHSGARFVTTTGNVASSANFDVGINGGTGLLNVSGTAELHVGGQLSTTPGANPASTITLQDSASVNAGSFFNEQSMRIVGSAVNLSIGGNAILGGPGTHEWEFSLAGPSSGPSAMYVGGQLSLDGTLKLDTLGGTPAVGDAFLIADSASVIQRFTAIDTSDIPGFAALGQGVAVRVISAPDASSTHGVLTRAVIEQQPVLVVDRRSGEVSIRNPSPSHATVAFDAYVVGSPNSSLNASNWSSIDPEGGWQLANPRSTALSELNPLSTPSLAPNTTAPLGAVYQPADRPFGESNEDLEFRFAPDGSELVSGLVVYEGIPTDTLTLNIDRTTGAAQILNGFRETVAIDSYVIRSNSGALDPAGFTSIGGDWQTALNQDNLVSELNPLTSLELSANEGQGLGLLYDFAKTEGQEDFVFEFSLPTEDFFRVGKVVFDDMLTNLESGLAGDFNGDGNVDGADFLQWQRTNGSGAALAAWEGAFGTVGSGLATASAVPEPCSGMMVVLATSLLAAIGARRQHLSPSKGRHG
jgi:hypothetical protein